jgi:hypothetical protein
MPHIGIERFGTSHRQKDRPEHDEAAPGAIQQDGDTVARVERQQYAGRLCDTADAEQSQHGEPHHGADLFFLSDERGTVRLQGIPASYLIFSEKIGSASRFNPNSGGSEKEFFAFSRGYPADAGYRQAGKSVWQNRPLGELPAK